MEGQFEVVSRDTIGAALAVHRSLGPGLLESAYHNALRVALTHRGIPFESQLPVELQFEGVSVGRHRLDLVVAGELVVELKAVAALLPIHVAQLRSYLRATHLNVGLLLNFNAPRLTVKRVVQS